MKVIILAGGLGTRLAEETIEKPKPMVEINGKPILWHLMNIFSVQGYKDFVLAVGYKHEVIENWIKELPEVKSDDWKIEAINTGLETQTGGRIKKIMQNFQGERVLVTYGDGLANAKVKNIVNLHESSGTLATVTAVRPPARFGYLEIDDRRVVNFGEKNQSDAGWINGGFFVLEPEVEKYINGPLEPFETGALPRLVRENQLTAYLHEDFWQPMDTLREKHDLEKFASQVDVPWLKGL